VKCCWQLVDLATENTEMRPFKPTKANQLWNNNVLNPSVAQWQMDEYCLTTHQHSGTVTASIISRTDNDSTDEDIVRYKGAIYQRNKMTGWNSPQTLVTVRSKLHYEACRIVHRQLHNKSSPFTEMVHWHKDTDQARQIFLFYTNY